MACESQGKTHPDKMEIGRIGRLSAEIFPLHQSLLRLSAHMPTASVFFPGRRRPMTAAARAPTEKLAPIGCKGIGPEAVQDPR